jgi:hypothetical protein
MRVARLPDQESPRRDGLGAGVTLNMIIVAPWPMAALRPSAHVARLGTNRSLTPSVRVRTAPPLCGPAFLHEDANRQDEVRRSEPRASPPIQTGRLADAGDRPIGGGEVSTTVPRSTERCSTRPMRF